MERPLPFTRKRRHSSRQGASTSQDEEEQPPRSRLRTVRAASRTSSSSIEIVDVQPDNSDVTIDLSTPVSVCVVDLTDEQETARNPGLRRAIPEDVVDLTDIPDNQTQTDRAPPRRRSRRGRPARNSQRSSIIPILSDDSDEENDIMVLPEINICNSYRRQREEGTLNNTDAAHLRHNGTTTPNKRAITCPICMEDENSIRNNGHHLMSTNCGHVFCRPCIRASIQSQHRCPTCRKKLTIRQIHPIFL
ncbi:E3 ubiquitin-protein ligase RNF4-like [Diadema setosum]|uniref:E3 ubiquitin-protein ligase RNF4-like n=1 Tax=Diadema setosum TaxID=31175 RepID=UPI003B3B4CDA